MVHSRKGPNTQTYRRIGLVVIVNCHRCEVITHFLDGSNEGKFQGLVLTEPLDNFREEVKIDTSVVFRVQKQIGL